jgi:hypothetical protein
MLNPTRSTSETKSRHPIATKVMQLPIVGVIEPRSGRDLKEKRANPQGARNLIERYAVVLNVLKNVQRHYGIDERKIVE